MNEPSFPLFPAHHLDPGAQEFFPMTVLPSAHPQIYYPPPPPPYATAGFLRPQFPPPPAYSFSGTELPPTPPPLPVSLAQSSPAPSRTLLLSMVPASVSESAVRRELEVFGDVRAVEMGRRREGLVTVHFYDVRDAQAALAAVQNQHMQHQYRLGRHYDAVLHNPMSLAAAPPPPLPPLAARGLILGRVVWAQFTAPITSGLPDGNNQGTLVIFNLEPMVPAAYLREIFEAFGPVKELRETPNKKNQKFVEFYDVRDAARALSEMNGKQIHGRTIVIEYSRPGGQYCRKFPKSPHQTCNKLHSQSPNSHPPRNPWRRCLPENKTGRNPSGSDKSWSSGSTTAHEVVATNSSIRPAERRKKEDKSSDVGQTNSENNIQVSGDDGGGRGRSKQPAHGGRAWKGGGRRGKERDDPRFLINEQGVVEESNCRDPRTTVMIKNIPNKYSQKLLLNMLDNHCIHCNEQIADAGKEDQPLSSYDFLYLPIDFINKCNVGYGFVNMTSPEATLRLYKAFHHQNWEVFNSRKICQVTYARLQGVEALREHFKNSKFPDEAEEHMPVVFSPPRDGRVLSDPVPLTSRTTGDKEEDESSPPDGRVLSDPVPLTSRTTGDKEEDESQYHDIIHDDDQ